MNRKLIGVIASLLVLVSSEPRLALASPASSAPPIQLSVCRATITPEARTLQLKFADVGTVTASAVVFTVHVGTWWTVIRDAGTFSPGARIDHSFRLDIDIFPWTVFRRSTPQAQCTVKQVDFEDGSRWEAWASRAIRTR